MTTMIRLPERWQVADTLSGDEAFPGDVRQRTDESVPIRTNERNDRRGESSNRSPAAAHDLTSLVAHDASRGVNIGLRAQFDRLSSRSPPPSRAASKWGIEKRAVSPVLGGGGYSVLASLGASYVRQAVSALSGSQSERPLTRWPVRDPCCE